MKKTVTNKKEEKVFDATGNTLGRLSSAVAKVLLGKDTASFERNVYCGAPVKVINASKIKYTEKKLESILHKRYSGHPGGYTELNGREIVDKKGFKELIRHSVEKMLPGNKLRREMMKNLKIEE